MKPINLAALALGLALFFTACSSRLPPDAVGTIYCGKDFSEDRSTISADFYGDQDAILRLQRLWRGGDHNVCEIDIEAAIPEPTDGGVR